METPPIFIGGTGRSGTSIMATLVASHADYCLPSRENKLIADRGGLRSLEEYFMHAPFEYSGHHAISSFVELSQVLRERGIKRRIPRLTFRFAHQLSRITPGRTITERDFLNVFPSTNFSTSGIGHGFGLEHYDAAIRKFLDELIEEVDVVGVFGQRGYVRPLYVPKDLSHEAFLGKARSFLQDLYAPSVTSAGAKGWCDDSPLNVVYADFLLRLFPNARVIHMVRHPMDTLNSWLEQSWTSDKFERGVSRMARDYKKIIEVTDRLEGRSLRTFKIEDMAHRFEKSVDELCQFCGISKDYFDGSVKFNSSRHARWQDAFSIEKKRYALEKLGFAIDFFAYSAPKP